MDERLAIIAMKYRAMKDYYTAIKHYIPCSHGRSFSTTTKTIRIYVQPSTPNSVMNVVSSLSNDTYRIVPEYFDLDSFPYL